jgi:hypothetical protein
MTAAKSTDRDYDAVRNEPTIVVPKAKSIQITNIQQDIIDGGVPVVDAVITIEIEDGDVAANHEYEVFVYEV